MKLVGWLIFCAFWLGVVLVLMHGPEWSAWVIAGLIIAAVAWFSGRRFHSKSLTHAAGLLAGSYFTADLLGYTPETVVGDIELRPGQSTLIAIPVFSKEIEAVAGQFGTGPERAAWLHRDLDGYRAFVLSHAREAGLDTMPWVRAKVVQAIAGPAAWGKLSNTPLARVRSVCRDDFEAAVAACRVAGLTAEEGERLIFDYAANLLQEKFSQPPIWNGVSALAAWLPIYGRAPGTRCWAIFSDEVERAGHAVRA